jgi:hypothetical protein
MSQKRIYILRNVYLFGSGLTHPHEHEGTKAIKIAAPKDSSCPGWNHVKVLECGCSFPHDPWYMDETDEWVDFDYDRDMPSREAYYNSTS